MGKKFNDLLNSDPDKSITITKGELDKYLKDTDYSAWVLISDPSKPTPKRPWIIIVTAKQFELIVRYIRQCLIADKRSDSHKTKKAE